MTEKKQRSHSYWKKRMAALEEGQYQRSAGYYKDAQEQFRIASNSIQMDIEQWYMRLAQNNGISYAGAKRLLKRNELEEFHWTVGRYIKAGKENALDQRWIKELENASARHHISYLGVMKMQIQQHAERLTTEFDGGMTDFLHQSYVEQYYRNAFEVAKGTGIGTNLARLDTRKVEAIIKKPWARDGADFSDRIWTNKERLVHNLHTELTQSIIRGESPQKAIDKLANVMKVSRSQAGRLIMTESAALASAAQRDALKELGVEQYEILATLDSKTSELCREMDGRVFDMKDYVVGETAPPFHPNCRTTTVPYFDDEFTDGEERTARDEVTGKTYDVPADMKYTDWEQRMVIDMKRVDVPETLKVVGSLSKQMEGLYQREISMIPSRHMDIMENAISKVMIDPTGNSRYDRLQGILYLAGELDEGEVIHEMAHALESSLDVWNDPKFIAAMKKTLGGENQLFYVLDDVDTFVKPIQRLNREDVLISMYQGRIYEEIGAVDDNWEFNYYSLGDFFSEAYREYVLRPEVLREMQPRMFAYIEEVVK